MLPTLQARDLEIDCRAVPRQRGDRFLLCSDGLLRVVGEEEIARVLAGGSPAEEKVDELIRTTLERGAPDNVTVIVVQDETAAS